MIFILQSRQPNISAQTVVACLCNLPIIVRGDGMRSVVFISLLIISFPAMAYIDPGSGSAIMSAIVGFFVALGLAIKTYWYKLKSLFSNKKIEEKTGDTQSTSDN